MVVVGGGVAGLAALNTLLQNNVTNVVLLEAQDRLGGRVRTYRQGGRCVALLMGRLTEGNCTLFFWGDSDNALLLSLLVLMV